MKKAMKQLFQKGISGILCAAMILTSLSIPEMTAYAAETGITEETETADKTNDGITNESGAQDTDSENAKESEGIPGADDKNQDSDLDADKDANFEVGGGDSADDSDSADDPDETAPEADEDVVGVAEMEFDETQTPTSRADGSVTLNFYVGDVADGETIGIYQWGGLSFYSEDEDGETVATAADWHPWTYDTDIAYLMTHNAQYAGWYSINIKADSLQDGANFEIFRSTEAGRSDSASMIKCAKDNAGQYGNIFNALTKNDGSVCAVKDFGTDVAPSYKLFEGTDAVNAIMRTVTLHIYSKSAEPVIVLDKSDDKLKYIDESAEIAELNCQEITIDEWDTNCYDMEAEEQEGWYKLTFIVPDSDTICNLYLKESEGQYTYSTKFVKGAADNYSVQFPSVLTSQIYYKDGKFSESLGITFGALKGLITDVGKLVESEYTTESWGKLQTALNAANTAVTTLTNEGKKDTDVDDEGLTTIADAYNNLDEAIKELEKKSRTITFNYYAGDTDGKGVGVYTYSEEDNISSDADKTTWNFWGNPIYKMEATDYFGWYTIPITFSGSSTDQANFQICIEGGSVVLACGTTNDIKSSDVYLDEYEELFTGTDTSYAVKEVGDEFKLYKGDAADAVMRNVTLHIYSESGVPAIVLDSGKKLTYIDESTGTEADLQGGTETTIPESWAVTCYDMEADETANWYSLSFTVPTPGDDGKFFDLAIKDAESGDYTWNAKFMSGDSTSKDAPNFKSALEDGKTYFKDGVFYKSPDEFKKITIGELKTLINTAKSEEANKDKYTKASWDKLTEALTAAETLVEGKEDSVTDEGTSTAINDAYKALNTAIENLTEKGNETTFSYYVGDTGKEVGLYFWSGNKNISVSEDAVEASWHPWNNDSMTAYLLEEDTKCPGWYTIPISFAGNIADNANFQIYVKEVQEAVFKCGSEGSNSENGKDNVSIYNKVFSAEKDHYAVKDFGTGEAHSYKLYEGADDVNAAMRNVKLYVYSKDAAPAIGSKTALSTISASGDITALDASNTDTDINYYNMTEDAENDGWYYLTFSAPVPAEDSNEICGLYTLSGTTYTPAQTFVDGEPSTGATDSVNFNPVFSGSVYYNGGQFYESMELALGITLGMLKAYLESEDVKTVEDNGDTYYTEATWKTFSEAKDAAEKLIGALGDTAGDESKSPAITAAYSALKSAVEGMKKQDSAVTFYYYNDSIAEDEELGLTFGGEDNSYSTADVYEDWYIWDKPGNVHKMTAVEGYPGWYTIPVVFVADGTTYEYCIISSHKQGDPANTTKEVQVYDKNYPELNDSTVYAYKSKYYVGEELVNLLMRNVALYVYDETAAPTVETANKITGYVDESTGKKVAIADTEAVDGVYHYNMELTEDTGWYSFKFAAPQAGDNKEIGRVAGGTGSDLTLALIEGATTELNSVDLTQYFGKSLYYKDGQFYDVRPYTVEELTALINEAVKLRDDDLAAEKDGKNEYYHDSKDDGGKWDNFKLKIEAADVVAKNEYRTDNEIKTAYDELRTAMKELVHVPQVSESISVEQVALEDDFITGADLSSYVSLKESGTIFKDENGKALSDQEFFDMLYEGGTNWVRIRVWNDPYDSNGNGYGGGNSDLDKAKTIGKLATNAGMKVLIDFHYSDFWADPSKQETPKEWEGYTIEEKEAAVYQYTLDSLNDLAKAGVNVGMVQVGNETNNAICGENDWAKMAKIFNAGSRAVREFSKDCLVAVHFADPSSTAFDGYAGKLAGNDVDYDVFAASYYPFWHGGIEELDKLKTIAETYNKKVMVAETSWVTTWEDGDGHGNTSPKTTQTLPYAVSPQGQADEMQAVIAAVNNINEGSSGNPAIGVFYWEPAWISPNYVYNGGSKDQNLYNKNIELWEKYGSGWASSYAAEYDPTDAGLWYGGSAVDNQAWFDFNGKAIETYKTYSYIRTGAVASDPKNSISSVQKEIELKINVGEDKSNIKWPNGNYQYDDKGDLANGDEEVVITFSDGTKASDDKNNTHYKSIEIKWDEDQQALVNTDRAAVFTVDGVVKCEYYTTIKDPAAESEPSTGVETFDVTLTIEVLSTGNILDNPGFEYDLKSWDTDGTGINKLAEFYKNPRSGEKAMAFWSANAFHFTIEQTVEDIKPGTYTAGGFIEGNGASAKDVQTLYVIVTDSANKSTKYEATCSLNGWMNWANPEISNIKVSQGDKITVGMEIQSRVAEAWGSIDDMYLYGKYGLNLGDIKNGVVNVSNMEADSKEVVRIAAMPENGYYLSKLELTGETVTQDILKDESGLGKAPENETDKKAVLIYNDTENKSDETMQASFVMPEGSVTLNAEFTQVTLSSVSMDNVVAKGFTPTGEKYIYNNTQEYTGKKIELDLDLSYMGYKLTTADYTAKYKNNVNKTTGDNMAEITVTAKGKKFTGKKILYFNIDDTKVDISKAKAALTDDDQNKVDTYYYTGTEIEPVITGLTDKNGQPLKNKDGSGNLTVSAEDYTIYYQKNIKVGKASMTVIANSASTKIKGSFTQTFTIAKRPIVDNNGNLANGITIVDPAGGTYTGSKITPNVTVKYGNKELQKGRDYTVTYKNNVNVSKGAADNKKPSLKITGKGNYTGVTKEYYFEISAKSISDYGMRAEAEAIAENQAPKITLKNGTKKLTLNKNYRIIEIIRKKKDTEEKDVTIYKCDPETGTVDSESTVNKPNAKLAESGEYTVTLSGIEKGGYTGTQTVDFKVIDKEHLISAAKVTIINKALTYKGSEITLEEEDIEVKNSKGSTLKFGTDYELSYNDVDGNKTNIKAGKATVTVTGKGDYAGTKTAKFTIAKRAVTASTAADKAVITYEVKADTLLDKIAKKTESGSALELPYTGIAWTPELDIYSTNDGAKKLLINGTDYTISYKNNLKPGSNASIIIKGKGNYSGSVKIDNVFTVKNVTLNDFVISINPVEYNGKALKPAINFVYKETGTVVNMKAGAAYTVKYTNNKNVASIESAVKPTATITEKGLNTEKKGADKGKIELPFTITTARITPASVSEVKMQTYNGKPSKPALNIKVNGKKLKAGTDYVVTYSGNTLPNDKATARIIGIGNYSGAVNKTFVIK